MRASSGNHLVSSCGSVSAFQTSSTGAAISISLRKAFLTGSAGVVFSSLMILHSVRSRGLGNSSRIPGVLGTRWRQGVAAQHQAVCAARRSRASRASLGGFRRRHKRRAVLLYRVQNRGLQFGGERRALFGGDEAQLRADGQRGKTLARLRGAFRDVGKFTLHARRQALQIGGGEGVLYTRGVGGEIAEQLRRQHITLSGSHIALFHHAAAHAAPGAGEEPRAGELAHVIVNRLAWQVHAPGYAGRGVWLLQRGEDTQTERMMEQRGSLLRQPEGRNTNAVLNARKVRLRSRLTRGFSGAGGSRKRTEERRVHSWHADL